MSRSSSCVIYSSWGGGWVPWIPPSGWCGPDLVLYSQEKRRKQAEIESRRRQLEDDRRQLQHLKVGLGGRGGDTGMCDPWNGLGLRSLDSSLTLTDRIHNPNLT